MGCCYRNRARTGSTNTLPCREPIRRRMASTNGSSMERWIAWEMVATAIVMRIAKSNLPTKGNSGNNWKVSLMIGVISEICQRYGVQLELPSAAPVRMRSLLAKPPAASSLVEATTSRMKSMDRATKRVPRTKNASANSQPRTCRSNPNGSKNCRGLCPRDR